MSGFVDECNLHVTAGDGGAGCVAFRRESRVPRGGPAGGDGGRGGHVWLVADRNVASLLAFRDHPHRRAASGKHGSGNRRHGARGSDLEIKVPVGTVVLDHAERTELADLESHGARWRAVRAGDGGRGNARFLANNRRAPAFAEQGEYGESRWLRLELKLLADVAIVGFPNVGKSTFISRVSAARPKIADYPFTTLEPNLGVARIDDEVELVLADIPGLIEGAADGRGLGHRFLRHTERSRVLLVLIDLAEMCMVAPARQLEVLLGELGRYRPELLERPRLVIGSRADMAPGASFGAGRLSSVTGEGVPEVMGALARMTDEARRSEPVIEAHALHRPGSRLGDFVIERRDDGSWEVLGRAALRAVALSDMTDPGALAYAQDRLNGLGVERALRSRGVREGDVVHIGGFEFEYHDDNAIDGHSSQHGATGSDRARRRRRTGR